MVVSWAGLPDHIKRKKLTRAYLDPYYFITDRHFMGDFYGSYGKPLPFQVFVLRRLWLPINEIIMPQNADDAREHKRYVRNWYDEVGKKMVRGQYIREFNGLAGMRLSKTTTCGMSSVYCMFKLHRIAQKHEGHTPAKEFGLTSNQKLTISNVAVNEDQSILTIFDMTRGLIEESPYFKELASDYTQLRSRITFENENVNILALGSNSSSAAGKTSPLCSIDEVDQFDDTDGSQGIDAVYRLLRNSTKTLWVASGGEFGKVQIISSSGSVGSKMWRLKDEAEAAPGYRMWMMVPTWYDKESNPLGNPLFTFASLREEREADPVAFWQYFGCDPSFSDKIFIKDFENIVDPRFDNSLPNVLPIIWEGIERIKDSGAYRRLTGSTNRALVDYQLEHIIQHITDEVASLNYNHGDTYIMTGDPSSVGDTFGVALAHVDRTRQPISHMVYEYNKKGEPAKSKPVRQNFNHLVVDGVLGFTPKTRELDVVDIEALFLATHKLMPYQYAGFDIWSYAHLMASLRNRGVHVYKRQTLFPEYQTFVNACKIAAIRMPVHSKLRTELKALEKIVGTTNVRVDHPKGGSKDLADAVVLALVGANQNIRYTSVPGTTALRTPAIQRVASQPIMAQVVNIERSMPVYTTRTARLRARVQASYRR